MTARRAPLLALAVALEAGAVAAVLRGHVPAGLALHVASSAGAAAVVRGTLLEAKGLGNLFLAFSCALFIPGMGALGLAAVAVAAPRRAAPPRGTQDFVTTRIPRPPERSAALRQAAAVPAAEPVASRGERDARVAALAAARSRLDRASVALLWTGLKDADEEVRLLAFALLEAKTGAAYRRIHRYTHELETADGARCGILHRRLAFEHWELVWLGLVQGEILTHELAQAEKHARAALKHEPRSAALHLLLGRIDLKRNRLGDARVMLQRAAELGMPPAVQRPYLAEVDFLERRGAPREPPAGATATSSETPTPIDPAPRLGGNANGNGSAHQHHSS